VPPFEGARQMTGINLVAGNKTLLNDFTDFYLPYHPLCDEGFWENVFPSQQVLPPEMNTKARKFVD